MLNAGCHACSHLHFLCRGPGPSGGLHQPVRQLAPWPCRAELSRTPPLLLQAAPSTPSTGSRGPWAWSSDQATCIMRPATDVRLQQRHAPPRVSQRQIGQSKACTTCERHATRAPRTPPPAPRCQSSGEAWPRRDLTNTGLPSETTSPGAGNIWEPSANHGQEEEAHLEMVVIFCSRLAFETHVLNHDMTQAHGR